MNSGRGSWAGWPLGGMDHCSRDAPTSGYWQRFGTMGLEDNAMSASMPSDLEAFYDYVGHTLNQGDRQTPPEALLRKWREERELAESCEDIRQGIANMEAGLGRPAEEVFAELRRKHGISDQ